MKSEEIIIYRYTTFYCFMIIITTNGKYIHLFNMLSNFDFVSIMAVITTVVIVGYVTLEPLPIIPRVVAFARKFQAIQSLVEFGSRLETFRNTDGLQRNGVSLVRVLLVFEGELESDVVGGVTNSQTGTLEDPIQLEVVGGHDVEEVDLVSTDFDFEDGFTSRQFDHVEESIGSRESGSVNQNDRNVLDVVDGVDVDGVFDAGEVHIAIGSQRIAVSWKVLDEGYFVLGVEVFQ